MIDGGSKGLYRLIKLDLLFQVQLHDSVVVIDAVAVEVVHLSCGKCGKPKLDIELTLKHICISE